MKSKMTTIAAVALASIPLLCFYTIVIGSLMLVACDRPEPTPEPTVGRLVVGKASPVESRVSLVDTLTGNGGVRTKGRTVFYIYAEGGYYREVDHRTYQSVEVGDILELEGWLK
jgi:hypothetical protein